MINIIDANKTIPLPIQSLILNLFTMPPRYNQKSFQAGRSDSSDLLLCLYCSLVELELAIKEYYFHQPGGKWTDGHCIIDWLTDLGEASLGKQLKDELEDLYCTNRKGSQTKVKANKYPDIRYLRHEKDFPGESTDHQLKEALGFVRDIRISLINNKGIDLS